MARDSAGHRKTSESAVSAFSPPTIGGSRCSSCGRLCDHLHAAVENLFPGKHELRVAAAEERREHLPEMLVHLVEGRLQTLTRFAIDAPDRVLQCRQRLVEVL